MELQLLLRFPDVLTNFQWRDIPCNRETENFQDDAVIKSDNVKVCVSELQRIQEKHGTDNS